ncbi:SDR family NAD(P)-dependent oxidoreductase [Pseudonocardia sp. DSM 110487]|uniref:SDR family NAD(P)-dependent oxidoreductase n=1 Tax=Pseudonocardia sp. DSM 110487 TaxID=2865833 RepID=UPI00351D2070
MAGALGVLDLGEGDRRALEQLVLAIRTAGARPMGIRVAAGCGASMVDVSAVLGSVVPDAVVIGPGAPWPVAQAAQRWPVVAEVTSVGQARAAVAAGARGLVARGAESGGRVGELGSFVLLQQLLADPNVTVPVWACGGIGTATAAAAVAGGAAGVVLDTQLALMPECSLPESAKARIALSDGTGTSLADGYRTLGPAGLPAGQDSYLASRFVERYGTTARAVRAIEDAIEDAIGAVSRVEEVAVAPGSALARALGTALPVAQGPMTRVSDQAGFARAVADAGALPFLALALSSAEQTRTLLEQASAALGDAPWGVGVLGFAADEIRTAQLRAIREFRPSVALIAGGRPDQAAVLEDAGIATFLHVPSPALLRQFLKAGVRKFVFEGAECGGHVGPRSSFCLWQGAIDALADFVDAGGDAGELQILFAGGVHDARSSAMVAAAAAPLTRRGAAVGVLMGTAYLFTEEAVAHGAVQPLFQRQAVDAVATVLLETAPGHVTRCLPSPFTSEFAALRGELLGNGIAEREVWQRLEELNVGRLRIASKGLRRDGGELVEVDESAQYSDGLFMAGQVAVLRLAATDLATLHADVTTGAVEFLAAGSRPAAVTSDRAAPQPLDVAVVGMSAMFPGAPDLPAFWANVLAGVDLITEVSRDRWDVERYFTEDTAPSTGDRTYSKWGGFLPRIPFDALRYGIPPAALASIEPVQLLALEAAQRALADAGYADRPFDRERTSVIFGTEAGSDLARATTLRVMLRAYLDELPPELDAQLPRLTEDSFPGKLANVISGRIANRLDLGGANYTVDAACGSSLAAVDAACKELLGGTSDVVLCGGADLHNSIEDFLLFASVGALSPTGRCRPFDADGDGIALGEGVGCVVLKRLADAERDGDRIYAVIKGIGSGSDGRAMGLTAPRAEGQRRALERAYRNAGVTPSQIGLVEAHGTGTVVGDRTELTTLTQVFTDGGATPGSCVLGSVKSQIGHTKCAAGMAGMIKTALAVHTGVLPPTRIARPNPAWNPDESPFVFRTEPSPWTEPAHERTAAVSAFGFGGTNFHLVLSGHQTAELATHALTAWPAELFLVRGADRTSAVRQMQRLRTLLSTNDTAGRPWALRDFARTVAGWSALEASPVRLAFVAGDLDELARLVHAVTVGETPAEVLVGQDEPAGEVAVLFPGQGSQHPGMLAELFVALPELRRILDLGGPEVAALFPPAAFGPEEARAQRDRLRATRVAQPALGIAGMAVHELLARCGVRPDMYAGHSYGELVGLAAAGALAPAVLLELSVARAEAILDAAGDDPGAMAAVSAACTDVERVLAGVPDAEAVVVANHNATDQTVISGPSVAVEAAVAALREASLSVTALPVACAFHSPVVAAAGSAFGAVLDDTPVGEPDRPVWANRTAAPYPPGPGAVRAELAAQIGAPVRFAEQIDAMYGAGARVFVEAGPGAVLGGLVGKILDGRPHTVVSLGEGGLRGFLTGLARLAAAGVDVRAGWLHTGRPGLDLTFAEPPARPRWTVDGHLVRAQDGDTIPGGLAPARRVHPFANPRTENLSNSSDRDALIADFLRTSRELVSAQRDVMLGYLGASPVPASAMPAAPPLPQPAAALPAASSLAAGSAAAPAAEPEPAADPLTTVVAVIGRKTGYPEEMIEPDMDLEADLSVDSIKRTEIAVELAGAIGNGSALVDELVRSRTATAMAAVLGAGEPTAAAPSPDAALVSRTGSPPHNSTAQLPAGRTGEPAEYTRYEARSAGTPSGNLDPPIYAPDFRFGTLASRTGSPPHNSTAQQPGGAPSGNPDPPIYAPDFRFGTPAGEQPGRYLLELADASADADVAVLVGATIAIVGGDHRLAEELAGRLSANGALPVVVDDLPELEALPVLDGLVSLHAVAPGVGGSAEPVLPAIFPLFQSALPRVRWCVAVASPGGRAWGLSGFFRSLDREYPQVLTRLIELDAATEGERVAEVVTAELQTAEGGPVVVHGAQRRAPRLVAAPLDGPAAVGASPAVAGAAELATVGLDPDSVVLLVGGARGITARVAGAVAAATRCRIELAGRTVLHSEPEPAEVAAATDLTALRGALAVASQPVDGAARKLVARDPVEIDRRAREILARREVDATLSELRERGSLATYHTVDVTDGDAVAGLVKQVYAERGRIDCVVFAAGVIEDRLVGQKDPASFSRVYRTKVDGARALLGALEELPEPPRSVVFFGSIAAVLGNRGQADYAAANAALEAMGAAWSQRTGIRAVTVHWGPWAPRGVHGGMVSEELARSYGARGIALLEPDTAVSELFRELACGDVPAVLYTASAWWR